MNLKYRGNIYVEFDIELKSRDVFGYGGVFIIYKERIYKFGVGIILVSFSIWCFCFRVKFLIFILLKFFGFV